MWKYIITWCIGIVVSDPCPDANKVDEFGRSNSYISCSVMHYHIEQDCNNEKVFYNRDSAYVFYKKALSESKSSTYNVIMSESIYSIKIDSILIIPITSNISDTSFILYNNLLVKDFKADTIFNIDTLKIEIIYSFTYHNTSVLCVVNGYQITKGWEIYYYDLNWDIIDNDRVWLTKNRD